MPAQTYKRKAGLKSKPPRQAVPLPGVGGYAYPPGPYGATGFPGSTAAARKVRGQTPRAVRHQQRNVEQNQLDWNDVPARTDLTDSYMGGTTEGVGQGDARQYPKWPGDAVPSLGRVVTGRQRMPHARTGEETATEHRMTPIIGAYTAGPKNLRNDFAQRWKADPRKVRDYKPAANPGKTGAHLNGTSQYHGGQQVWGDPDGKPIPGMPSNLDGPSVRVQSRYFSDEGAQEGYAMNRAMAFDHGGVAAFPPGYDGVRHIRGGRLTGQRYFGALADQQQIGLPSDSYGIKRRRGPNHRPVRFEQPAPWSANYYDVPADQGTQSPDMIHRSAGGSRRARTKVRRG